MISRPCCVADPSRSSRNLPVPLDSGRFARSSGWNRFAFVATSSMGPTPVPSYPCLWPLRRICAWLSSGEEAWFGGPWRKSVGRAKDPSRLCFPPPAAADEPLERSGALERLQAERRALEAVVRNIDGVPPGLVGAVASAWRDTLEADPEALEAEPTWREDELVEALLNAPAEPLRDRALVRILRRQLETRAHPELAAELAAVEVRSHGALRWLARISRVLASPSQRRRISALGDLDPPPAVRAWLDHVHAVALFEARDLDGLRSFGNVFLRRRGSGPVDAETFEVLLDALLSRPAPEALSIAAELGERAPSAVRKRWWSLGLRALERGQLELSRKVLDRLWFEAAAAGIEPPAELPMILAARARVALARLDVAAFEALANALEASASRRERRRAVLALAQDAVARLAEVAPSLRRPIGTQTLRLLRNAFGPARLPREAEILARWDREEDGATHLPSRRPSSPLLIPLGEARVARRPRAIPPPEVVLQPQPIPSFLVWETAEGVVRYGLPPPIRQLAERKAPSLTCLPGDSRLSRHLSRYTRCVGCRFAQHLCVCDWIQPTPTETRVVVILHPREQNKPSNSGHFVRRLLSSGEARVADAGGLIAPVGSANRRTFLLFPHEEAAEAGRSPPRCRSATDRARRSGCAVAPGPTHGDPMAGPSAPPSPPAPSWTSGRVWTSHDVATAPLHWGPWRLSGVPWAF